MWQTEKRTIHNTRVRRQCKVWFLGESLLQLRFLVDRMKKASQRGLASSGGEEMGKSLMEDDATLIWCRNGQLSHI